MGGKKTHGLAISLDSIKNKLPRFDTPCPRCVGYTISMCGLKTNGTCVGSGSLSSTFGFVVPLNLPKCTLGRGIITAHMSPLFFSKKKNPTNFNKKNPF